MEIRLANVNEIENIMQLIRAVVPIMNAAGNMQWDSTYPNAAVFEKDINLKQLWVAEIDYKIVGVAAITTDQDQEYAEVGWDINELAMVTHRLAVDPSYQGRGIAAALLLKAEEIAIERGIHFLRIDTNSLNKATQHLFQKLGYVYSGEIGLGFRPGLRFYCYQKILH